MENITIIVVKPEAMSEAPKVNPSCDSEQQSSYSFLLSSLESLEYDHLVPMIPRMMPSDTVVIPVPELPLDAKKDDVANSLGVKFVSAGLAACVADMATFPLDTAKVRLQIQGEGVLAHSALAQSAATRGALQYTGLVSTLTTIAKKEGLKAWYQGLGAGLQRQMCFASVRIGLYDVVKGKYSQLFGASQDKTPFGIRVLAGMTTGSMAVLCAQPTDVVKTRLQAQTAANKRYHGAIHAYRTIAAQEGVRGLWKGLTPNVARNSIVNVTELVSYDLIKEFLLSRELLRDGVPCHFSAALGAGLCTTALASPVDVVKTRFMNSAEGTYRGPIQCAVQMYKSEGPKAFYKGCLPSFLRLTSWSVIMFITYEQVKRGVTKLTSENRTSIVKNIIPLAGDLSQPRPTRYA